MTPDRFRLVSAAGLASLGLAAGACADSDPEIWSLEHEGSTFTVGDTGSLAGTFEFAAPDGELAYLHIELLPPTFDEEEDDEEEAVIRLPPSELESAEDEEQGTLEWRFHFQPEYDGEYEFELYVIDENENESNRLEDTFRAQTGSMTGDFRAEPAIVEARVRGAE